jgi:hypothetical protein
LAATPLTPSVRFYLKKWGYFDGGAKFRAKKEAF